MYKLTLLLIPLLFLSSCSIDWNDEKDKNIVELEKQVTVLKEKNDDELFKKKRDCQKQYNDRYWTANRFAYENLKTDIFYSQYLNTCISTFDWWRTKDQERVFLIVDILAEKTLHSFAVDKDWGMIKQWKLEWENLDNIKCNFNKKVQEIKWTSELYFNIECPGLLGN